MTETRRPVEPPSAAPRSGRPSLTGDDAARSGQSVSVLSAVTPPSEPARGPVPKSVSAALPWIGVVTLAIIGIIFWMELSGPSSPPPPPSIAAAPPVTATSPASAEVATAAPVAAVVEPTSSAATIETERPVPPPTAPAKKPVAAPDAPAAKAAPTKLAAATPPVEPVPKQRSPFTAIEKPPSAAAPSAAPRKPRTDRDTDLVAALLSRSPTGAPAAEAAKPVEAPKPSRDVVERDPVISTDKLLKRCESLGVLEAELCKARICSGLWGKDNSCPARAPAPPPAAASAAQTSN